VTSDGSDGAPRQDLVDRARAHDAEGVDRFEAEDYPAAATSFRRAQELYLAAGDAVGATRCLQNQGAAYDRLGRYEEAQRCLRLACQRFRELDDEAAEAECLMALASVLRPTLDHIESVQCYLAAARIFEIRSTAAQLAECRFHLAATYEEADQDDDAIREFANALEPLIAVASHDRAAECATRLGNLRLEAGAPDPAIAAYERARHLWTSLGQRTRAAECTLYLGQALGVASRFGESEEVIRDAHQQAVDTGNRELTAAALFDLAHTHLLSGRLIDAEGELVSARALYDDLDQTEEVALCSRRILYVVTARAPEFQDFDVRDELKALCPNASDALLADYAANVHAAVVDATRTVILNLPGDRLRDVDPMVLAYGIWEQSRWPCVAHVHRESLGRAALTEDVLVPVLDAFTAAGLDAEVARTRITIAHAITESTRVAVAVDHLLSARDWFHDNAKPVFVAMCTEDVGVKLAVAGQYSAAAEYLDDAARKHDAAGEDSGERVAECRRRLAIVRQRLGDHSGAVASFEAARSLYLRVGLDDRAADCTFSLACLYAGSGQHRRAVSTLRAAKSMYEECANDPMRAVSARSLGLLLLQTDLAEAGDQLAEAADLFASNRFDTGAAESLRDLGVVHTSLHRYREAVDAFTRSCDEYTALGLSAQAAATGLLLGSTCRASGRLADAEQVLRRTVTLFEQCHDDTGVARSAYELGAVLDRVGRHDDAIRWTLLASTIFRSTGSDSGLAECMNALGDIHRQQMNWAEAEELFVLSHDLHSQSGDQLSAAYALSGLSEVYLFTHRAEAAVSLLQHCLDVFSTDAPDHVPSIRINMGVTLIALGRPDEAMSWLSQANAELTDQRRYHPAATADWLWCIARTRSAQNDSHVNPHRYHKAITAAIETGLPALLFIDAQRFQFSDEPTRRAWSTRHTGLLPQFFEWAAELKDERLLAELVETTINSGSHSSDVPSYVGVFTDHQPYSVHGLGDAAAAGPARLVDAAILPMRPPPRLLLSPTREALSQYHDRADERYEPIGPRRGSIPTW